MANNMKGELTEPKSTVQNLYLSNLLLGSDGSESHKNVVKSRSLT